MKKVFLPVLMMAGLLLLQGCGGSSVTESTIEISKKGAVTQTTIGTLEGDYFDSDEFRAYAEDQVDAYNDNDDAVGTVKLKKYKYTKSSQMVKIVLTFTDADTYEDFENLTFFVGTIDEAEAAGYDFAVTMIAAQEAPSADEMASGDASSDASDSASSDAASNGTSSLGLSGEEHVVILQESYNVTLPGDVLYVTDGVCGIVSDDTVSVYADGDELVYIIYES